MTIFLGLIIAALLLCLALANDDARELLVQMVKIALYGVGAAAGLAILYVVLLLVRT